MNLPVNISLGVIDNLMRVFILKLSVRAQRIAVDRGASFNVLGDFTVKRTTLSVRDYHRSDLTVALQQAHHSDLASSLIASSARSSKCSYALRQSGTVHIPRLAADVSFVNFNFAR